jgi:hypothetical protein
VEIVVGGSLSGPGRPDPTAATPGPGLRRRDLHSPLRALRPAALGTTWPAGWRAHERAVTNTREASVDAELAVPARGEWLAMHLELAWIYKCRLTEEFARRNNLFATTDQVSAHAVVEGPFEIGHTIDSAAQIPATAKHMEMATAFGLLAITAVVPRDLD